MEQTAHAGKESKQKSTPMQIEKAENSEKKRLVKAKDIARTIKSFDHFVYIWGSKGKYYLPPKSVLTWHYISQVLAKEKRLLKLEQVGHQIEIPKVKGTLVNDMFHEIKHENGLHFYFPDLTENQNVPRNYFFNVNLFRC